MAGPGGGPSRRSHTKSRKGCKTCKKRHIRCDEQFPQCRNCTKHQVRCDYNDSPHAMPETPKPPQPNLLWTAEIDATIEHWQRTGDYPFPDLRVFPQPHWAAYTKTDLRLIHHFSSISHETFQNMTSRLTIWTDMVPKFLSIAASHPFVMHAILAFSATHIAWITHNSETRALAYQYAGLGLRGLHEGIASFTRSNSDAVLASSLLLAWQANDWRPWASLVTGTQTVIQAMRPWRHDSMFSDYIAAHSPMPHKSFMDQITSPVTEQTRRDRLATLSTIQNSLQRLQPYLSRHIQESKWVEQFSSYIERLRTDNPPQSAREQFAQLYFLRKWLFWVPITLLTAKRGDPTVLVVLAHLYAVALALEPLFKDIGSVFCADLALQPLEHIIPIVQGYQDPRYDPSTRELASFIQYPSEVASRYKSRPEYGETSPVQQPPYGMESLNLEIENQIAQYSYAQNPSPAFAPSPLTPSSLTFIPSVLASGQTSPYLEVPRTTIDGYGSTSYATPLGTPASVPPPYSVPDSFSFGMPMGYHSSGDHKSNPRPPTLLPSTTAPNDSNSSQAPEHPSLPTRTA